MSHFTHLACSHCQKRFAADQPNTLCDACNKPLLARYDLGMLKGQWRKADLLQRPFDMWRYRELLPIKNPRNIVSLGETVTPLLHAPQLGKPMGLEWLYVKDESRLPTGTFKARGFAMAVSKAVELGIRTIAIPSAGNAAEAGSAYAARAGITCFVFMPKDAPLANQRICRAVGARVYLVDGLISDAGKVVREGSGTMGWFDLATFREPYRLEGKKTMGLELAEQLDWELPDVIVYPTGGGTGLVGMWKAFEELEALGWIGPQRPRMVSVQAQGCAPIVRAFERGAQETEFWEGARTLAGGLRVPHPLADRLILKAIRDSGGSAVAVSDDEIKTAMGQFCASEGLLPSPESASTLAALEHLRRRGEIRSQDRVVLFSCGTLLKHVDLIETDALPLLDPKQELDYGMFGAQDN